MTEKEKKIAQAITEQVRGFGFGVYFSWVTSVLPTTYGIETTDRTIWRVIRMLPIEVGPGALSPSLTWKDED